MDYLQNLLDIVISDTESTKKQQSRAVPIPQLAPVRKEPVKYYMPNMLFNRLEFVADYFHLAVRGFKFSPEITAKYEKYGGPKIGEIITEQELQELEKLRRNICKKSLSDYGYTMSA